MNIWKVLAIIFIVLFVLETAFMIYAVTIAVQDENKTLECYYDVCSDYPDAYYEDKVCSCYDENSNLVKQEVII